MAAPLLVLSQTNNHAMGKHMCAGGEENESIKTITSSTLS